jgi:hypothetical protein
LEIICTFDVDPLDRILLGYETYKWMSKGNGRMSTLKKAGGTTGD